MLICFSGTLACPLSLSKAGGLQIPVDPAFGVPLPDLAEPISLQCGEVALRTCLLFPKGSWEIWEVQQYENKCHPSSGQMCLQSLDWYVDLTMISKNMKPLGMLRFPKQVVLFSPARSKKWAESRSFAIFSLLCQREFLSWEVMISRQLGAIVAISHCQESHQLALASFHTPGVTLQ